MVRLRLPEMRGGAAGAGTSGRPCSLPHSQGEEVFRVCRGSSARSALVRTWPSRLRETRSLLRSGRLRCGICRRAWCSSSTCSGSCSAWSPSPSVTPSSSASRPGWAGWGSGSAGRLPWSWPAWSALCWRSGCWWIGCRVRLVGPPVRARWRLALVYRRHWQPVMVTAGLGKVHRGREYLPSIRRVECGRTSDRVLVRMLTGQAPGAWERVASNLAHGFGVSLCRVREGDRPGRVWLEFVRRDALADPIPALPIPHDAAGVDLAAVPVGRREDGTPWLLRLLGTHVLIAGATGSGKGSVIWSAVRALLPAMRSGWVRVWALDPKRMELSYGRGLFARYACNPVGMVELLEAAVTLMHERAEEFGGKTRTFTPTVRHPFLLLIVDELAFLTAYQPERDLRKRAEAAIATLTSQGRSVGVCVLGGVAGPSQGCDQPAEPVSDPGGAAAG
jgi:hypothetical protein